MKKTLLTSHPGKESFMIIISIRVSSVDKAIKGAKEDGLTNSQMDYLNRINAFYMLNIAMLKNKSGEAFQVEYEEETDRRRKQCESSYMFETYNLD